MNVRKSRLLKTGGICCGILIIISLFVMLISNNRKGPVLMPNESKKPMSKEPVNLLPKPLLIVDSPNKKDVADINEEKSAKIEKPQNFINVKDFGVKGDGVKDDLPAMKTAVETAIRKGLNVYMPKGNYRLSGYFPVRNTAKTGLLDCKNIVIYGDGNTSHVFTNGPSGIDVFQLNAIKNITIKNLKITSKVTKTKFLHGSNAVSITGGGENIHIENLNISNLPIVKYSTHIDGGKGVTIQPANTQNPTRNISISNCHITGCAYGVGIDLSGSMVVNNPLYNIKINGNNIITCWRGISIGSTDAQKLEDGFSKVRITVSNNTIVDCNNGIFIARAGNLKVSRNTIRKKALLEGSYAKYQDTVPSKSYGIQALGLINSVIEENQINCDGCEGELAIGSINSSLSKVKSSVGNQISKNKLMRTKVQIIDKSTVKAENSIIE